MSSSSSSQMIACFAATVLLLIGAQAQVRQCSCDEQAKCLTDLKAIGEACVDQCWSITGQITKHPDKLRKCFGNKEGDVVSLIDCFNDKMEGCVDDAKGPMIAEQSINGIMSAVEEKIRATIKSTLDSGLAGNMGRIIDVTEKYGQCAKQCILKKTAGGVCQKKYNCEPLMPNEAKAKQLFNKCTHFNFKKEGGPLCQCALNAGVQDLSAYCSVLSLMGPKN